MKKLLKTTLLALLAGMTLYCVSCTKEPKPLDITYPDSTDEEIVIEQNTSYTLNFTVGELGKGSVDVTAVSSDPDYTVSSKMKDDIYGEVTVTSPKYIFESSKFNVILKLVDTITTRVMADTIYFSSKLSDSYISAQNPANCYIAKEGSMIKFPTNIGNTADKASYSSIDILWQDNLEMIDTLFAENGFAYAVINPSSNGNVIISGKADDGSIVWNWHLWIPKTDPTVTTLDWTSKGGTNFKMMDRNLGAIDAVSGTDDCHGLFYQWGRPTPFSGSTYLCTFKTMYTKGGEEISRIFEPVAEADNMSTAIANPLTHYSGVSGGNYSWITNAYSAELTERVADYWGGVSKTKTKYDPCPDGWKVAQDSAWYFMSDAAVVVEKVFSAAGEENANLYGRNYNNIFFPAQGEVAHGGQTVTSCVGSNWPSGKTWSCNADPSIATSKSYFRAVATSVSPTSAGPKGGLGFGYELPVRCVKY